MAEESLRVSTGARESHYTVVKRDGSHEYIEAPIIHEDLVSVYVNGLEVATVMCSPREQEALALGFLANEGIIDSLDEVVVNRVCNSGGCVDDACRYQLKAPPDPDSGLRRRRHLRRPERDTPCPAT